uniref:Major pepsin inhibitor 3 n=1 Tax=Ascaris suum TaxID=6253 RepID=F1LDH5_ASCSU
MKEAESYKARLEECQKIHDFSNNCTKPPSFCGGNDIKMYNFAGCIVLGNKLYKNGEHTFVTFHLTTMLSWIISTKILLNSIGSNRWNGFPKTHHF